MPSRRRDSIPSSSQAVRLPAGARHAWDQTIGRIFTECETGHLEATHESAATTGHAATVDETCRAGVTRKHGQTDIIFIRLQLFTEFSVFRDSVLFALFALEPAFLSLRGGGRWGKLSTMQMVFALESRRFSSLGAAVSQPFLPTTARHAYRLFDRSYLLDQRLSCLCLFEKRLKAWL